MDYFFSTSVQARNDPWPPGRRAAYFTRSAVTLPTGCCSPQNVRCYRIVSMVTLLLSMCKYAAQVQRGNSKRLLETLCRSPGVFLQQPRCNQTAWSSSSFRLSVELLKLGLVETTVHGYAAVALQVISSTRPPGGPAERWRHREASGHVVFYSLLELVAKGEQIKTDRRVTRVSEQVEGCWFHFVGAEPKLSYVHIHVDWIAEFDFGNMGKGSFSGVGSFQPRRQ